MKIRALVSFSGVLCMRRGQEVEYDDNVVLQDLLQAGYIEEVTPKEGVKKNESKRNRSK